MCVTLPTSTVIVARAIQGSRFHTCRWSHALLSVSTWSMKFTMSGQSKSQHSIHKKVLADFLRTDLTNPDVCWAYKASLKFSNLIIFPLLSTSLEVTLMHMVHGRVPWDTWCPVHPVQFSLHWNKLVLVLLSNPATHGKCWEWILSSLTFYAKHFCQSLWPYETRWFLFFKMYLFTWKA